jgi:NhaA family Na+:H+ antiporter
MTENETILARAGHALTDFFRLESAGGILLIAAAALALLCANSPLEAFYDGFRELPVAVQIGELAIAKPLLLWINDGLMAVFFLLVALEIKREALSGQLSSRDQLILPLVCAVAGVAVPAVIFWWINRGDATAMQGWAIPAATDIAFALGILSLLGSRVPAGMKLLLSTIAVVDDLAAIVIIALFYTSDLSITALGWAVAAIACMFLLNRRKVTALTPYLLLGIVVWVCVLKSGVHATLAGVITGLMIPHYDKHDDIDDALQHSPLETLEHALHPWVAYLILPVFAFANAGLALGGFVAKDVLQPVPLGIVFGLVLGKPIGIIGAALLAKITGIARYPQGMGFRSLVGLGLLCGVGFTMSLFIASLAFSDDGDLFQFAVLGVLCASVVAAIAGYLWLRATLPIKQAEDPG